MWEKNGYATAPPGAFRDPNFVSIELSQKVIGVRI